MGPIGRALVAVAAGLALADAAIVALALPPILVEMHTTITGVAAIVGVYALVLGLAVPFGPPVVRAWGPGAAGATGLVVFAAASLGCSACHTLTPLLVLRAVQAAGGAIVLVAAFALLDAGTTAHGRRLWLAATLVGTAAGPAIGGVLTEVFSWHAIFVIQAPIAAAAALACLLVPRQAEPALAGALAGRGSSTDGGLAGRGSPGGGGAAAEPAGSGPAGWAPPAGAGGVPPARTSSGGSVWADPRPAGESGLWARGPRPAPPPPGDTSAPTTPVAAAPPTAPVAADAAEADVPVSALDLAALALVAAAFTAVLFLLVIELVAGFALSPLHAALGVSVLPVAAIGAAFLPGSPAVRAASGAVLLAGGAAALAYLPSPSIAWTVVPQVLAGAGMGLAVPAFATERTLNGAAIGLAARQAGIVVVLAILAPVATHRLAILTDRAVLQGTAVVLDSNLPPLDKIDLAPALVKGVDADHPREELRKAIAGRRSNYANDPATFDALAQRLDDVIVSAVLDAFRTAYLIAAALALLATLMLVGAAYRRPAFALAVAIAIGCPIVYAAEAKRHSPKPVVLQDPCQPRVLPQAGGFTGALQNEALKLLDQSACKLGATREELVLALADPARAKAFERRYGVNPRSGGGLLSLITG